MERAVKLVKKDILDERYLKAFKEEINILKQLDHPYILKLYEIYEDKTRFFVVTELCKGGELFDELIERGKYGERDAASALRQILQAIAYCHSKNITHRDLKPENILIDKELNNSLKIIDFGAGTLFEKGKKLDLQYGTSYYIAPEVLEKNYNEKCDIWSLGVIMYILLSGIPPFNGHTDMEIIARVKKGEYSL